MPKNDDREIWAVYAKSVRPIGRTKADKSKAIITTAGFRPHSPHPNPPRKGEGISPRKAQADFHIPLDRNFERRLRQGDIEIGARIDLHGMRQDEAFEALHKFVAAHIKAGRRCLLVITGKGRKGPGVLRASLSGWLAVSPLAAHILALRPASARHGGDGAFYVILRQPRDRQRLTK